VTVPDTADGGAVVRCRGCGSGLGTWRDFLERTRRIAVADARRRGLEPQLSSSDPLVDVSLR
jgi:hypothetical protein